MEEQSPSACLREEFAESDLSVSLRVCYNCSTCSTACPVALETNGKFNPRTIVQLANCGYEDRLILELTPNIWDCTMCEICQEVCPQHVNLHEIFIRVKNAAAEELNIPESYSSETQQVYLFGKAVPIQPAIAKRREQLGLEPSTDVNLEEIQKLMQLSGLDHLLEKIQNQKTSKEEK